MKIQNIWMNFIKIFQKKNNKMMKKQILTIIKMLIIRKFIKNRIKNYINNKMPINKKFYQYISIKKTNLVKNKEQLQGNNESNNCVKKVFIRKKINYYKMKKNTANLSLSEIIIDISLVTYLNEIIIKKLE